MCNLWKMAIQIMIKNLLVLQNTYWNVKRFLFIRFLGRVLLTRRYKAAIATFGDLGKLIFSPPNLGSLGRLSCQFIPGTKRQQVAVPSRVSETKISETKPPCDFLSSLLSKVLVS